MPGTPLDLPEGRRFPCTPHTLNTCTILRLSISECISIFQVTAYYVKGLEKDKSSLEKQIRDMEWRLDQESKVPHFGKNGMKRLTSIETLDLTS